MNQRFVWWQYLLSLIVLVVIWELAAISISNAVFPGPVPAILALFDSRQGELPFHFLISSYRVISSLLAALFFAVPLGLILGRNLMLDRLISPMVYVIYPIPKIVFFPLIMILLGIGDVSKIFIITLIVFFQVLVTTRDAVREVSPDSIYSARSLGARGWQIYFHVIIPSSLPKLLTAVRISLGTAIAVLFLAETVAGSSGLGYYILSAMYRREYNEMFAGIISMGVLGLTIYLLLETLENRLCKWQRL